MKLRAGPGDWLHTRSDVAVLLLPSDYRGSLGSAPVTDRIRSWTRSIAFAASALETTTFPTWNTFPVRQILVVGLGPTRKIDARILRRAAATAARASTHWSASRVAAQCFGVPMDFEASRAVALGLVTGSYGADRSDRAKTWTLLGADRRGTEIGAEMGSAINDTRPLADDAGNRATPDAISRFALGLRQRHGLKTEVWTENRLRRERCHAILAVGQASRQPPRMIFVRHEGSSPKPPIVVVGKTITFDTGGISLKPAKSMEWMKYDKSGGMAVLALMNMLSRLRAKRSVIGILAVAENMPGGNATRPGDVIQSRAGKTIEVVNTDAEGRLVLADALSLAADLKPAAIVDLATLTGAAVTALGHVVSAVMGSERLVESLRSAGDSVGEKVWPLPLHDEYAGMIRTPFADLKNTGDGTAGAIAGGMFLRQFVPESVPWAHVDLTNAWEERSTATAKAGANLYGSALLCDWITSS